MATNHKVTHAAMNMVYAGQGLRNLRLEDFWTSPAPAPPARGRERWITWASVKEGRPPPEVPRSPGFLTKLRGRLSEKNVQGDLHLTRAPDDEPHRATIWRW